MGDERGSERRAPVCELAGRSACCATRSVSSQVGVRGGPGRAPGRFPRGPRRPRRPGACPWDAPGAAEPRRAALRGRRRAGAPVHAGVRAVTPQKPHLREAAGPAIRLASVTGGAATPARLARLGAPVRGAPPVCTAPRTAHTRHAQTHAPRTHTRATHSAHAPRTHTHHRHTTHATPHHTHSPLTMHKHTRQHTHRTHRSDTTAHAHTPHIEHNTSPPNTQAEPHSLAPPSHPGAGCAPSSPRTHVSITGCRFATEERCGRGARPPRGHVLRLAPGTPALAALTSLGFPRELLCRLAMKPGQH